MKKNAVIPAVFAAFLAAAVGAAEDAGEAPPRSIIEPPAAVEREASARRTLTGAASATDAETIVVTATRLATPLWETGSSVDVISAGDIDGAVSSEPSRVLEQIPGLRFSPLGTPGQMTSLFTRGGESDHTLLLQDGIRVNDQDSYLDWGRITMPGIQSVEIMRGTGSTLYGSDAVTGVISMETLRGEGPWRMELSAFGAGANTYRHGVTFCGSENGAALAVGTESYYYGGKYANSDYRHDAQFGRADMEIADRMSITLVYRRNEMEAGWYLNNSLSLGPGIPGIFLDPNDRMSGDDTLGSAKFRIGIGERYSMSVHAGAYEQHRFYESIAPNDTSGWGTPEGTTDMAFRRSQATWTHEIAVAPEISGTIVAGFEYVDDAFDETDTRWGADISASRFNAVGFFECHAVPVYERLAVTAGVRVEDNSQYGSFTTYRFSIAQRMGLENEWAVRGSIGKGFRCPSYTELYYPFGGNPDLLPEENLGLDAAIDYRSETTGLAASVVYFHNRFQNLIQYNMMTWAFDNIGEAETKGVEVSCRYAPEDRPFGAHASVTALSAKKADGEKLLRRPDFTASIGTTWKPSDRIRLGLALVTVGEWDDIGESGTVTAYGYTRLDATAEWRAAENVTVFAKCENVADTYYEPTYSFPAPGRWYTVGIKARAEF